jgi:hypothetical protein
MQNKTVKNEFGVLPVPTEVLCEAGITPYMVIQYSVVNGKLIVEPADTEDYSCDGDCEDCPLYDEETDECCADGDGDTIENDCDEYNEPVSLTDFLDCLSESEQKEAYRYLAAKLTRAKGCDKRG